MIKTIDTQTFTEEQREIFISGWENAGGYTGDIEDGVESPWCMPWYHGNPEITVSGEDVASWGAQYWEQCREEIEQLLADE